MIIDRGLGTWPHLSRKLEPKGSFMFAALTKPAKAVAPQSRKVAPDDRLLRTRDLLTTLGVSRSTLYIMIRQGRFPKPLRQGAHSRWLRSDADSYLKARVAECESA